MDLGGCRSSKRTYLLLGSMLIMFAAGEQSVLPPTLLSAPSKTLGPWVPSIVCDVRLQLNLCAAQLWVS